MSSIIDLPKVAEFALPQYDVITPHTKLTISIRSLLVEQEEVLKTSAVTDKRILEIINHIIYECIAEKKPPYDTYENFLKSLTTTDRDALLYGLVLVSYDKDQDYDVRCPVCGHNYKIPIDLTDAADIHIYDGKENLLKKRIKLTLPVSKYVVHLKAPTIHDELVFAQSKNMSIDLIKKANEYIIIDKVEMPTVEGKPFVVDNILDIYLHMRRLPSRDRKVITNEWFKAFGQYYVRGKVMTRCPNCESESEILIHPITELFRLLF